MGGARSLGTFPIYGHVFTFAIELSALRVEKGRNCVTHENDTGWPFLKQHRYLHLFVLFLHSAWSLPTGSQGAMVH